MTDRPTKKFHLGDILSITTGHLVSRDHIGGVYKILDWMTGESLMTHQLPRVAREAEGPLKAQHPDLADIVVPEFTGDREAREAAVYAWLDAQVAQYGETREVAQLDPSQHESIDPLFELRRLRPDAPIIAVGIGD